MSLASPGAGLVAAIDRDGQVFESVNNGQDWRLIPGPEGTAKPATLAIGGEPSMLVMNAAPNPWSA